MGKRSNERANHPKQRWHYLMCERCEACFRLPLGDTTIPAHRWRGAPCVDTIGASDVR